MQVSQQGALIESCGESTVADPPNIEGIELKELSKAKIEARESE